MSGSKLFGWAMIGLVILIAIRSIGLPDVSAPTNMDWMMYVLPVLFLIAGFVLVYKKVNGGWWMVGLGLIVLWLGYDNVADTGRNVGQGARNISENGISGWWPWNETSVTESSPARSYDLLVPAHGCSAPIENTNSAFWVDPKPKDPATGWPKHTEMVSPESGKGWVPYQSGARYSHLRYCDNSDEMWMTVSFYRGRL